MKEKKSAEYIIPLPRQLTKAEMQTVVENAAQQVGMYISHIGSYSRKKYPNSVHWHFKRNKKERGLIDATFWDTENRFWLIVRHREPQWVHTMTPRFLDALNSEIKRLRI